MTISARDSIQVEWWMEEEDELSPTLAFLEVEKDEGRHGFVAIHTMIDGTGSHSSYYLDREAAIRFARDILSTVVID